MSHALGPGAEATLHRMMTAPRPAVAPRRMRCTLIASLTLALVSILAAGTSRACVGTNCMEIWSTEPGSGALTLYWDFVTKQTIQTFTGFCAGGQCLYSTIDPGFITTPDLPVDGIYPLADGTNVALQIIAIDAAATLRINGAALAKAGDAAPLGTAPTLHVHPSWQLTLPAGVEGDYPLSFKLTTDSSQYSESQVFSVLLTNRPTPTPDEPTPSASPSPTPTPTPEPAPCAGDCNGDHLVTVDELVRGVNGALGSAASCPAFDLDNDGTVAISELVAAVNAALNGCPAQPTPTATLPATLDQIQRTIFSPQCAIPTCHDASVKSGNLVLEADSAYAQLVGVAPDIESARLAGLLRVDPGHPDNSFLLVKLTGPPPGQGSRMPLTGPLLSAAEIQLIRDWITAGALP